MARYLDTKVCYTLGTYKDMDERRMLSSQMILVPGNLVNVATYLVIPPHIDFHGIDLQRIDPKSP
jgi:hypothetical protein